MVSSEPRAQGCRGICHVELYMRHIMLRTDLCGVSFAKARKQRLAGRIAPHKQSERFQECEHFIGRSIRRWRGLGCIAFFKCPPLHL